jgi:hypothetical protein
VAALLEVDRGHDDEVDGAPQVNQILLREIEDLRRVNTKTAYLLVVVDIFRLRL